MPRRRYAAPVARERSDAKRAVCPHCGGEAELDVYRSGWDDVSDRYRCLACGHCEEAHGTQMGIDRELAERWSYPVPPPRPRK
jgi:hypothetical protein